MAVLLSTSCLSHFEMRSARFAKVFWWVAREVDQRVRISSRDLLARRDCCCGA